MGFCHLNQVLQEKRPCHRGRRTGLACQRQCQAGPSAIVFLEKLQGLNRVTLIGTHHTLQAIRKDRLQGRFQFPGGCHTVCQHPRETRAQLMGLHQAFDAPTVPRELGFQLLEGMQA